MNAVNIILLAMVVLFILESAYCLIKQKQSYHVTQKQGDDHVYAAQSHLLSFFLLILKKIDFVADSFTFMLFKICGYIPSHFIRKILYRYVFHMRLRKHTVIYYGLEARDPWNISIDEGSVIGDHCILDARNGINIGKNVNISTGAKIWTLQHDVNSPTFSVEGQRQGVIIGNNVWISSNSTLLPGVNIENGCVLAAGAVATKSLNQVNGIYCGIPAKFIAYRKCKPCYSFNGEHRLFL